MTFRWLTVFLDFPAPAFEPGVAFWREVTGYGLSAPRGRRGEFATLLPASGDAYLRVQRVAAGGGGCHLDLHVDTAAESLESAASRAARLGAVVRHRDADGDLIIADSPGGFTFCLVRWDSEATVPGPLVTSGGASRVDTLCLDVPPDGFDDECAFWSALTGWSAQSAPVPGFSYRLHHAPHRHQHRGHACTSYGRAVWRSLLGGVLSARQDGGSGLVQLSARWCADS